jgi:restriction system protein
MVQAWIIRAGRDDEYESEALAQAVVALGWQRLGDLTEHHSQTSINRLIEGAYAEFSPRSRQSFAVQLYAFCCRIRVGDYVVLMRSNAPDVAVGTVQGEYAYRPDLAARHVRPVQWARVDVRRTEIGADLLTAPALTSIYRINRKDAQARLSAVIAAGAQLEHGQRDGSTATPALVPVGALSPPVTAAENLRRNLDYAFSLATAGHHLQKLKVEAFEVSDVFRAAWVQAVAALDHWVRQEVHERMLAQTNPSLKKGDQSTRFKLPPTLREQVRAGTITLSEAVDSHWNKTIAMGTFQSPHKISVGFAQVADVTDLWPRVARVLTERSGEERSYTADQVEQTLKDVVFRRNKIAHEYDEDPASPPAKRPIDAASTTRTIQWIDRLTQAVLVVLDGAP